jgi:hypothetical protein
MAVFHLSVRLLSGSGLAPKDTFLRDQGTFPASQPNALVVAASRKTGVGLQAFPGR